MTKIGYRKLIVETPSYKNEKYLEAKNIYNKHLKEFHKRYIRFISKRNKDYKFNIILIGFDGKIKHTYKKLNPKKIFSDISKMPIGNNFEPTNLSLYEDYNPKTTIKNLGFKDKEKALYTINKIKNKNLKYQKNVINTMYNRAKYHPNRTKDMEEAMKIFKRWLNNN